MNKRGARTNTGNGPIELHKFSTKERKEGEQHNVWRRFSRMSVSRNADGPRSYFDSGIPRNEEEAARKATSGHQCGNRSDGQQPGSVSGYGIGSQSATVAQLPAPSVLPALVAAANAPSVLKGSENHLVPLGNPK